jgi:hypothetical protein
LRVCIGYRNQSSYRSAIPGPAWDAPVAAFADLVPRYPVFELLPVDDARR